MTTVKEQGLDYEVGDLVGPADARAACRRRSAPPSMPPPTPRWPRPSLKRIYDADEGARRRRWARRNSPTILDADLARWREVAQAANIRAE